MTDYTELKRLADSIHWPGSAMQMLARWREFEHACEPKLILALIAEVERLTANVKLNLCDHPAVHWSDVDLLVASVLGASQVELAKVHGCTPPNISRKIRRVKGRLGWRDGMTAAEIRARAEQLRSLASQGAVVTADLMVERNQLRAEVAGLRTGYEAYERVNAELKAENEALRAKVANLNVNGFAGAFYTVAEKLGITGARPISPMQVFASEVLPALQSVIKDAERYRFVSRLAWYVDQASYIYDIGNAKSPWEGERAPVDADDVESAIDAAMGKGDQS